jgi:copper chaperone CopZ
MNKTELDIKELEDILNPSNRSHFRTDQIGIDGVTSEELIHKIEETLSHIEGVQTLHVDSERQVVIISYDSRLTNMPELHDALLESGYKPTRTAS